MTLLTIAALLASVNCANQLTGEELTLTGAQVLPLFKTQKLELDKSIVEAETDFCFYKSDKSSLNPTSASASAKLVSVPDGTRFVLPVTGNKWFRLPCPTFAEAGANAAKFDPKATQPSRTKDEGKDTKILDFSGATDAAVKAESEVCFYGKDSANPPLGPPVQVKNSKIDIVDGAYFALFRDSNKWFVIPAQNTGKVANADDTVDPADAAKLVGPMACPGSAPKICIDVCRNKVKTVGIEDRIIPPNRSVTVVVRPFSKQRVLITQDGDRGVTELLFRRPDGAMFTSDQSTPECGLEVSQQFAPRKPGHADIRVSLFDADTKEAAGEISVELEVEQTSAGALRLGLAPIFGPAVDDRYFASKAPGDDQAHIALAGRGPVDLELVVGFAPFLDSLWGGRGYATGSNLSNFPYGFSPYIGLGAVAGGAAGLDALKSFHLGLEWEMTKQFSVAGTVVGRRVTRLDPSVNLGTPVGSDADIPTYTRVDFGVAIVFSVTPDFLRLSQAPFSELIQ